MSLSDYYISGFTIKRPVESVSGGVVIETFSDLAEVSGRLRPLTGNEILANERIGKVTTDRFYCDVIDIEEKDRIYDANTSKTYEVKNVKNPMNMDHHLEVDCELKDA